MSFIILSYSLHKQIEGLQLLLNLLQGLFMAVQNLGHSGDFLSVLGIGSCFSHGDEFGIN